MKTVVVATPAAEDELAILSRTVEVHGLPAARRMLDRFKRARRSLERLPHRGRVVPELRARGLTSFRELVVAPFRMIYRVVGDEVWIVALVDGRRDLAELVLERARR